MKGLIASLLSILGITILILATIFPEQGGYIGRIWIKPKCWKLCFLLIPIGIWFSTRLISYAERRKG